MVVAPLPAPLIDVFLLYGPVFGPTARTVAAWFGGLVVQAGGRVRGQKLRPRAFDRPITLLNSRAVTIYLWHDVCILTAGPRTSRPSAGPGCGRTGGRRGSVGDS
ncbi:hypothetical protein [Streptomyces cyaneofuscatus]|uniref:hypothetical protein n=1 Tax=Streptomyces cyaneofuscatus TaxID=66883 RepID=UPI00378D442A